MTSLQTIQLLSKTAQKYRCDKEHFSKEEIRKKIDEIKYLSTQRKIPKLTLRKEIIHLENKLQKIFYLEQELNDLKKKDSIRVSSLKKEITILKKKLYVCKDQDLQKKINKLSHFLGEILAKKGTKEEIKKSEIMLGLKKRIKHKHKIHHNKNNQHKNNQNQNIIKNRVINKKYKHIENQHVENLEEWDKVRLKYLEQRLNILKTELDINIQLEEENPKKVKHIKELIANFEKKLDEFYKSRFTCPIEHEVVENTLLKPKIKIEKGTIIPEVGEEIKHQILFETPKIKEKFSPIELKQDLPLPPPPKMGKKTEVE